MKISIQTLPAQHYYAICNDCTFTEGAAHGGDIPRAKKEISNHVAKTGHTVSVETAHTIIFSKAK